MGLACTFTSMALQRLSVLPPRLSEKKRGTFPFPGRWLGSGDASEGSSAVCCDRSEPAGSHTPG